LGVEEVTSILFLSLCIITIPVVLPRENFICVLPEKGGYKKQISKEMNEPAERTDASSKGEGRFRCLPMEERTLYVPGGKQ